MIEAKRLKGHGGGTNMDWFCIRHVNEKLGFGDEPAIMCVDMTVHAPEASRPNVIFSTYENSELDETMIHGKFFPNAHDTWEQVAFAKKVLSDWKNIKNNSVLEFKLE